MSNLTLSIKICVLGETVGKSCLINRFLHQSFDGQHIKHKNMEEIYHKQIHTLNKTFDIEIIDTSNNHIVSHNNGKNKAVKENSDEMLHINLKGIDNYSMDVRKSWITSNDVLFLLFNRLNRISWRIIQNIHTLTLEYLSSNIQHIPIYIISTCCDLYKNCNLQAIDLVSLKEVQQYVSGYINVYHFETSAKLNQNIDILFKSAIRKYNETIANTTNANKSLQLKQNQPRRSSMLRWLKKNNKNNNNKNESYLRRPQSARYTANYSFTDEDEDEEDEEDDDIVLLDIIHNPQSIEDEKMELNNTIYSGYLFKCGKIVKNWKLRYFVFCGDNELRYYTSSTLEICKGFADLSPDNVVSIDIDRNPSNPSNDNDNDNDNGYPFIILCKNRTWKFRARTSRERQQWIEMLKSKLNNNNNDNNDNKNNKNNKKSVWKTFKSKNKNKKNKKVTKTLRNANKNEDAMDIFGISNEQNLYTLHIYQAKNIPLIFEKKNENVEVYISIEFNQCKSGNKYKTSPIYNCIHPIFNACICELAEKSEIENILLNIYQNDEIIGTLIIDIDKFNSWHKWIWLPIIINNAHSQTQSLSQSQAMQAMLQLKLEYISLDAALIEHQNKDLDEYSHIVSLHIDKYISCYSGNVGNEFINPSLQIQWKFDEIFCTQFADDKNKWKQSFYLYCQLSSDDKQSNIIFNLYNKDIKTGNDIIGRGHISWQQLKNIKRNKMQTIEIAIYAQPIILTDHNNDNIQEINPIGYVVIDVEISPKQQILQQFYRKFFTLHWFKKVNSNEKNNYTFTTSEIYSMLLEIGIHLADKQYKEWINDINDIDIDINDIKENEAEIGIDEIIDLVLNNKHMYETSVSLTHYITAYLNFKNSKKFIKLPTKNNINNRKMSRSRSRMVDPIKSVNNILDSGWWIRFDRGPLYSLDKDDLFVLDRKSGLRMREHVPGYIKIALKCMYDAWMTRIDSKNIEKYLNIFAANKSCKFDEKSSSLLIAPFIKLHNINMQKYKSATRKYKTFNDFFTRDIIIYNNNSKNKNSIISPCCGKVVCFNNFSECTSFWVKGSKFNIRNLIGDKMYKTLLSKSNYIDHQYNISKLEILKIENKIEYKKVLKLICLKFCISIIRLSPSDYHGYHYPFNGRCVSISQINGALYSISPIVVTRDVNVLTENKRCCVLFENEETFGFCCMIIIASFLVGSYSINCKVGQYVKCGELMGKFKYGGSGVILLFNKNKIKFDQDLINTALSRTRIETIVQLHSQIATVQ